MKLLKALIGGIVMFLLAGCGKSYRVNYICRKDVFINAKDSYRSGSKVTLSFYYATDTDYHLTCDPQVEMDTDVQGGILSYSFRMPDQDITIDLRSENSMVSLSRIIADYSYEDNYYEIFEKNGLHIETNGEIYSLNPECLVQLEELIEKNQLTDRESEHASFRFNYYESGREVYISADEKEDIFVQIEEILKANIE